MNRALPLSPSEFSAAFPFSGSRPLMITWAPFLANSRAVSRPMPAVPPVTRATLLPSSTTV